MHLYSRYLLSHYFRILALTLGTFIAFLIVYQLQEAAQFASLGVPVHKVFLFILFHIPFLLPLALPLSCLLASLLLMQRLSHSHEVIALRASGYSLMTLLLPLLGASAFLSLGLFYTHSEMATYAHRKTREMVADVMSINPLAVLQQATLGQLKGAYVRMHPISQGSEVSDVVVALPSRHLVLGLSQNLTIKEGELQGGQTTWITTLPHEEGFDHLILENLQQTHSPAVELITLLRTKGWRLAHDHLNWKLLCARQRELASLSSTKAQKQFIQCKSQKILRISLGMMPLTFTWIGAAFGIEIQRRRHLGNILFVAVLTLIALISVFAGKELGHLFPVSVTLLLLPHVLLGGVGWVMLQRIQKGRV